MYGSRAKIAFMLPSSCLIFEPEFVKLTAGLGDVIGIPARLLIEDTALGGIGSMNDGIELAARQLATSAPDVALYMCTTGSFMDGREGDDEIKRTLGRIIPGAKITTTSEAVVDAMAAQGMKSVAMLTPYDEETTNREVAFLQSHGIVCPEFRFRDIYENLDRGSVLPEESLRIASEFDVSAVDGIFLSCGNVRSVEILDELESRTGKPVVSSAQASIWKSIRLAGITEPVAGYGSLLREH